MKYALLVFLGVWGCAKFARSQEFETWRSGKFSVEAKLLDVNDTHIRLEKRDQSLITVPVDKLSESSLARLRRDDAINHRLCQKISGTPDSRGLLRVHKIKGVRDLSVAIQFSRDNELIFMAVDKFILAISTETGEVLHAKELPRQSSEIATLAVSDDGQYLAAGGRMTMTWKIRRDAIPILMRVSAFPNFGLFKVRSLAFSPDSEMVGVIMDSKTRVFETATGKYLYEAEKTVPGSYHVGFSQNNKMCYLYNGKSLDAFDLESGKKTTQELSEEFGQIDFTQDFQKYVGKSRKGYVVSGVSSEPITIGDREYASHSGRPKLSPDGKSVFVSSPQSIRQWSIPSGELAGEYEAQTENGGEDKFVNYTLSPCGRYIAALSKETRSVYLFQTR